MTPTPRAPRRLITALTLALLGLLAACDRKGGGPDQTGATPPAAGAPPAPASGAALAAPVLTGEIQTDPDPADAAPGRHPAPAYAQAPVGLYLEAPRADPLEPLTLAQPALSEATPALQGGALTFTLPLAEPPKHALTRAGTPVPGLYGTDCTLIRLMVSDPDAQQVTGHLGIALDAGQAPDLLMLDEGTAPFTAREGGAPLSGTEGVSHDLRYVDRDLEVLFGETCTDVLGERTTEQTLRLKAGWNLLRTVSRRVTRPDGTTLQHVTQQVVPFRETVVTAVAAH